MTAAEWLALKVGDVVIDRLHGGARHAVLKLSRASGKPEQRGKTRTTITVPSLRGAGRTTILDISADLGSGQRFELAPADPDRMQALIDAGDAIGALGFALAEVGARRARHARPGGTTAAPRALVQVGTYTRRMGGNLEPGDRIDRPMCAACVERTA